MCIRSVQYIIFITFIWLPFHSAIILSLDSIYIVTRHVASSASISRHPRIAPKHPAPPASQTLALSPDCRMSESLTLRRADMDINGNTDPRRSIRLQPAVRLSRQGLDWLNSRLRGAFDLHGSIPQHLLRDLDWPEIPVRSD